MAHIHSFEPVCRHDARILLLGSMPGKVSLQANQYYAHHRNVFWRIIEDIFNISHTTPYQQRLDALQVHRVALWDVLKTCTRKSSLDSDIEESSIMPNDFQTFFSTHQEIRQLYFNGAKAEAAYLKYVQPYLSRQYQPLKTTRLPSTSPANASMSYQDKVKAWKCIAEELHVSSRYKTGRLAPAENQHRSSTTKLNA